MSRERPGGYKRAGRQTSLSLRLLVAYVFCAINLSLLASSPKPTSPPGDVYNGINLRHDLPGIRHLSDIRHRYYLYNTTEMHELLLPPHEMTGYYGAVWSMYEALANHPLRTVDPNQATFFIPPIFINMVKEKRSGGGPGRKRFMRLLDLTTLSPIYQATLGSRHIIGPAVDGLHFSWTGADTLAGEIKLYIPTNASWLTNASSPWWNLSSWCTFEKYSQGQCHPCGIVFRNVILARDRDMWEIQRMHNDNHDYREWTVQLRNNVPMTSYGFSIGLMEGGVELVPATYEKYAASEWIFFYHSRPEPSGCDSTKYRHAPIKSFPMEGTAAAETYNRSSIGFDIDPKDWNYRYRRSKFCLVLRGDNPISRALLRSVRVGCIPIVVSDLYPRYAPSYKSTLNMTDYAILVDEQAFLANPWGELHRIYAGMTEMDARRKLAALEFAQRVIFPDHPESLFVEAYLREAWEAIPESERGVGCNGDCGE